MHKRVVPALAAFALLTAACADSSSSANAALETQDQIASYGVGLNMGQNLQAAQGSLDMAAFMRGVEEAMAGVEPAVPAEEIQAALQAFSTAINERMNAERETEAAENRAAGEAYLAENQTREGVMVTESGLQYEVLQAGSGDSPTLQNQVRIHYTGTLIDGTEFDSSRGGEPAQFGVGGVIPGFAEALQLMSPGARFRVVIPGDLAYGPNGSGQIGPDAVLIFDIEMLEII